MGELLVQDKNIVVPGEELATGMDYLPGAGTFRDGERIVAGRLGLTSVQGRAVKIIPLAGKYLPKKNDIIIGTVTDVLLNGWRVDTNSAYTAMLTLKDATAEFINKGDDLTRYYSFGDLIVSKIVQVTSQNLIDLSMKGPGLKKLHGGRVIRVNPHKVPRIIGKQGSMVSMVKNATGCRIVVGQNGVVWIQGEPKDETFAVKTVEMIEEQAHISGLTEKVKSFLEENGYTVNPDARPDETDGYYSDPERHHGDGERRYPDGERRYGGERRFGSDRRPRDRDQERRSRR
ncbi:RNA-binding protein [Candidatus Woesearchaeota archaeon]|nr:RNA-binding protein [Candidatus Woesearchaeota archaeon]